MVSSTTGSGWSGSRQSSGTTNPQQEANYMTENKTDTQNTNGGMTAATAASDPRFTLNKLYIKDLSFEAPNSPEMFQRGTIDPFEVPGEPEKVRDRSLEPEIQMNLKNRHQRIEGDDYEVTLTVTVHATIDDRTLYMIEVDQAGIFTISGYEHDVFMSLIGSYCPSTLFPYVRQTISSVIGQGGFARVLLQPINFDALYAKAMEDAAQDQDEKPQT
jgi:preprotein translocase subunit SecB